MSDIVKKEVELIEYYKENHGKDVIAFSNTIRVSEQKEFKYTALGDKKVNGFLGLNEIIKLESLNPE